MLRRFPQKIRYRMGTGGVKLGHETSTGCCVAEFDCDQALRDCQRGDVAALERLIAHFQQPVMRLAWRMTGDASLADEVAVEVFTKVWRKSRQWRGEAAASTWIYQLATRTALDLLRGRRRWWRRLLRPTWEGSEDGTDTSDLAERRDEAARRADAVARALSELSPEDRALVQLYYYEELPLAEIGAILGLKTDTLKMRLFRARKRLRETLTEFGLNRDTD
jgi:RNA polymerase sigma-70 factor (ECF subfamily)